MELWERRRCKERWQTDREGEQRWEKRQKNKEMTVSSECEMLMSNGLHYHGARQKGNGMIAPIIPACSPLPLLLFSLCLLAIQTVSPLASSLSSLFPLSQPPSSSWDLLLSSWRRSLICYIQRRRRGWETGSWSWWGGICKVEAVYRAEV